MISATACPALTDLVNRYGTMPFAVLGAVFAIIIVCIVTIVVSNRSAKEKKRYRIKNSWGQIPKRVYEENELLSISSFYKKQKSNAPEGAEPFFVDDITWNDLDMDRIYATVNATQTSAGDEILYYMLRRPCYDKAELEKRERMIKYFSEHPEERLELQQYLAGVGRTKNYSLTDYIDAFLTLHRESLLVHIVPQMLLCVGIGALFVNVATGVLMIIGILFYNIISYYKKKGEIEPYFVCISYIVNMVISSEGLLKRLSNVPEFSEEMEELKKLTARLKNLKSGSALIGHGARVSDGPGEMMLDYVRLFTHIDLIQFNVTLARVQANTREIMEMLEICGKIDALIAVASFRDLMPYWCSPEFKDASEAPSIDSDDMYHPLIKEPVANSFHDNRPVILTGSNASGKSTFLKTMAINVILAQSINTVTAHSYKASFFRTYSSMALRDDLESEESYYMVEIRSLKRIMTAAFAKAEDQSKELPAGYDAPVLCFVDEVLRGTNTVERIAASAQILQSLADSGVMCFAATHDIELTHLLEEKFANYHFREEISGDDVVFNYILYTGRSETRNAIRLLDMMGYDPSVTRAADRMAARFVKDGVWSMDDTKA